MKRLINLAVRSSICNFRCSYCYLNQKKIWFKNEQISYCYPPEIVEKAFSQKRLGGVCWFNICADGETLLAKDIVEYMRAILNNGHYIEFVSNMTITSVLNEILEFDQCLLERIEFKCSFHYLELKKRNLLDVFANNVNLARKKGCSICVEMIPDDNLIPLIDEIKEFSMINFGALPQLSIPRNDKKKHGLLSTLSMSNFINIWKQFDSPFFDFKIKIFKKRIKKTCYAGRTSLYVDLATGKTQQCYIENGYSFNIFEDIEKDIPFCCICKCNDYYCYNGHALLSVGCTDLYREYKYGDLRNRKTTDGKEWISPSLLAFMNEKTDGDLSPAILKKDRAIMRKKRFSFVLTKIKRRIKKTSENN